MAGGAAGDGTRRAAVRPRAKPLTVARGGASRLSVAPSRFAGARGLAGCEVVSVLFRSWWSDRVSFELSRLLNSDEGRHGARTLMELAGAVPAPPRGRLGLDGSRRERMCQLAISTLRATADLAAFLPLRLATSL